MIRSRFLLVPLILCLAAAGAAAADWQIIADAYRQALQIRERNPERFGTSPGIFVIRIAPDAPARSLDIRPGADLVVSCGDPADEPDEYTESRPRLIVEVLSPSTEAAARQRKHLDYQRLESLQDYMLIAQSERKVEVYSRPGEGDWLCSAYGAGETVRLPSIDMRLPVAVIYEDVP